MAQSEYVSIANVAHGLAHLGWFKELIEKKISPEVISYPFGEEIKPPRDDVIGIIAAGRIEICDSNRLRERVPKANHYIAYRPIRILQTGEFFLDFNLLDKLSEVHTSEIGYGEKWSLYAGGHSIIVTSYLGGDSVFHNDQSLPEPHLFLPARITELTKVAYIKYNDILSDGHLSGGLDLFYNELVRQCWKKAHAYRAGVNTYSIGLLTEFRAIADSAWDDLEKAGSKWEKIPAKKKGKLVYDNNNNIVKKSCKAVVNSAKTIILPIFSDALLDAIWRPIRRDPVFAASQIPIEDSYLLKINRNLKLEQILTAVKMEDGPDNFYYPIDLHNLEINEHCNTTSTIGAAVSALRVERNSEEDGNRPIDFYRELAEKCVEKYRATGRLDSYPYTITCIKKKCLVGHMLLLKFDKSIEVQ